LTMGTSNQLSLVLLGLASAVARFDDPWFKTYENATDRYKATNGQVYRLPLRLASSSSFLYGAADMAVVMAAMQDEDFIPVSVGGRAALNVWFNNFSDTDIGGGYYETFVAVSVTARDDPMEIPDDGPLSFMIFDPRAKIWMVKVLCADAPGQPGIAPNAITAGREVWGFPKHPVPANITFDYDTPNNSTSISVSHQGKDALSLKFTLPETIPSGQQIPCDITTPDDFCISSPKWSVKQTRSAQAFSTTEYFAAWDEATDFLQIHDDGGYGSLLKEWGFDPKLKVHAADFKEAVFKPSNWL